MTAIELKNELKIVYKILKSKITGVNNSTDTVLVSFPLANNPYIFEIIVSTPDKSYKCGVSTNGNSANLSIRFDYITIVDKDGSNNTRISTFLNTVIPENYQVKFVKIIAAAIQSNAQVSNPTIGATFNGNDFVLTDSNETFRGNNLDTLSSFNEVKNYLRYSKQSNLKIVNDISKDGQYDFKIHGINAIYTSENEVINDNSLIKNLEGEDGISLDYLPSGASKVRVSYEGVNDSTLNANILNNFYQTTSDTISSKLDDKTSVEYDSTNSKYTLKVYTSTLKEEASSRNLFNLTPITNCEVELVESASANKITVEKRTGSKFIVTANNIVEVADPE